MCVGHTAYFVCMFFFLIYRALMNPAHNQIPLKCTVIFKFVQEHKEIFDLLGLHVLSCYITSGIFLYLFLRVHASFICIIFVLSGLHGYTPIYQVLLVLMPNGKISATVLFYG